MTPHSSERVFRSPDKWVMRLLAAIALMLSLCIARAEVRASDDWLHIVGTFAIAMGMVLPFALGAILPLPDFILTEDGVARSYLGLRKKVRFADVTSVRCRDVGGKGVYRAYGLYTQGRDRWPVVTFRGDYDDIELLIAAVQREVTIRGIPVFGRRMGWPVPVERIPLPSEAPGTMW